MRIPLPPPLLTGLPLTMLAKLGIPDLAEKWPKELLPLGAIVGGLTPAAAAHLGLPAGMPVAQGGADAFIGMVGLGVVRPGQMALMTGSSHMQLGVVSEKVCVLSALVLIGFQNMSCSA